MHHLQWSSRHQAGHTLCHGDQRWWSHGIVNHWHKCQSTRQRSKATPCHWKFSAFSTRQNKSWKEAKGAPRAPKKATAHGQAYPMSHLSKSLVKGECNGSFDSVNLASCCNYRVDKYLSSKERRGRLMCLCSFKHLVHSRQAQVDHTKKE